MKLTEQQTKEYFYKTLHLLPKTLYKTIEFQILFKAFYIGVLVFVINFLLSTFVDALNLFITTIQLDNVISSAPFASLFDFQVITVLLITLFVFIYVYLVEKNGVIIITSEYYRNNFISFFKALLLSIRKTPIFIWRRIKEMRIVILLFIILYIVWKSLPLFNVSEFLTSIFGWMLVFYGAYIFFSVLFRYTFTAYTTCLYPKESYKEFNEQIPEDFLHNRTYVNIIFYTIFIIIAFIFIIIFSAVVQMLLYFSDLYPNAISTLFAFLVSFTIVGILVVLSFMKTFKVALMTTLYYDERKRQNKQIKTLSPTKQPILSRNLKYAILTLIAIITIAGALLTTTIKTKTDVLINNAHDYIEQIQNEQLFTPSDIQKMKDMDPEEFVKTLIEHESNSTTLDTIEKFVFTFIAYLIIQ